MFEFRNCFRYFGLGCSSCIKWFECESSLDIDHRPPLGQTHRRPNDGRSQRSS